MMDNEQLASSSSEEEDEVELPSDEEIREAIQNVLSKDLDLAKISSKKFRSKVARKFNLSTDDLASKKSFINRLYKEAKARQGEETEDAAPLIESKKTEDTDDITDRSLTDSQRSPDGMPIVAASLMMNTANASSSMEEGDVIPESIGLKWNDTYFIDAEGDLVATFDRVSDLRVRCNLVLSSTRRHI